MAHPGAAHHMKQTTVLEDFAEETGIFGFNLLRPYVHLVEKAFWTIVTLFFVFYTGEDIVRLTREVSRRGDAHDRHSGNE